MSDTLAFKLGSEIWLAKNSTRELIEAQRVEFYPAGEYERTQEVTYLRVTPQVKWRQAVILGRPEWMWGAEMGVNAAGVTIGTEAVFTRMQEKREKGLLGPDLVRLALEQGTTAENAARIIIHYIEDVGQGGPAGCRGDGLRYDNSFLIADHQQIIKLETAGRFWALKYIEVADSITNQLTIQSEADSQSFPDKVSRFGEIGFADSFNRWLIPRYVHAQSRYDRSVEFMRDLMVKDAPDIRLELQTFLSSHCESTPTNYADLCWHSGGFFKRFDTVNTMMVRLPARGTPQVWMTGAPHPCRQLFHEVKWGSDHFFADKPDYWERQRDHEHPHAATHRHA
ncbi:MAG: peptidase family C69 [Hahellaceae bacterium]|nr:peptidase family C69 [Hahellaceae bacterium]